jgi:hypothetical protein
MFVKQILSISEDEKFKQARSVYKVLIIGGQTNAMPHTN